MNKKLPPPPCETCNGDCCYHAPIGLDDWERVERFVGDDAEVTMLTVRTDADTRIVTHKGSTDGRCYFFKDGRCSIYSYRPKICRTIGNARFPCSKQRELMK